MRGGGRKRRLRVELPAVLAIVARPGRARRCPATRTANPRRDRGLPLADPEATVVRRRTELLGQPEPASRGAETVDLGGRAGRRAHRASRRPVVGFFSSSRRSPAAAPPASSRSFSDGSSSTRSSSRSSITPMLAAGRDAQDAHDVPPVDREVGHLQRRVRGGHRRDAPAQLAQLALGILAEAAPARRRLRAARTASASASWPPTRRTKRRTVPSVQSGV